MTRKPPRTGRGDPQGGSIQHGAGCGMTAILTVPTIISAVWRKRKELVDIWRAGPDTLRPQDGTP